ncbi:MAG: BrnA antitoxin family protein [Nostoc sp. TH1S01]|nr:BrnA antitoxin family protein [Nostoc sp. TH1S01]
MSDEDLSSTSRTNWAALEAMDDEGIDYSDIPPLTEEFFEKATLRIPATQAQQLVQIEPDVLKWFQAQDGEYKTLINSILRQYIESHSKVNTQPYNNSVQAD